MKKKLVQNQSEKNRRGILNLYKHSPQLRVDHRRVYVERSRLRETLSGRGRQEGGTKSFRVKCEPILLKAIQRCGLDFVHRFRLRQAWLEGEGVALCRRTALAHEPGASCDGLSCTLESSCIASSEEVLLKGKFRLEERLVHPPLLPRGRFLFRDASVVLHSPVCPAGGDQCLGTCAGHAAVAVG